MGTILRTVLISTVAALGASAAFAASSGTLTLSGTVASVNNIAVTPDGNNNTSLNITAGETGKSVANVIEVSNNPTGYKIQMLSTNGGQLRRTSNDYTTYQVSYDGGSYAAPTTSAQDVKSVSSLSSQTTSTSAVLVKVVAKPNATAGTYSDTVTFSIVANP